MGKLAFIAIGTTGIGAAGVGSFLLIKPSNIPDTTFKDKYSNALITDSDNLWDSKFSLLKTSNPSPKYPQLLKSFEESKVSEKEDSAKELMKQACSSLGEEKINDNYTKEFEKYCAKNNKDSSRITWNGENDSSNSWDSSLSALKSHNYENNGALDKDLTDLRTKIVSLSSYDNTHRGALKQWCEKVKDRVYWGPNSKEFKQQELYCKKE